jgi:hypothetical protein
VIGYEQLIDLRRERVQPSLVRITDGFDPYAKDWHREVAGASQQYQAHIEVGAQEIPEALDLRATVGLVVMVDGQRGHERTRRLFAAVVAAKPRAAIALLPNETLFFDSKTNGQHPHP